MWCDAVDHIRKECVDFTEALRTNVVYLWNGRVHASEIWKALELNTERGGMKRLMEEAVARHAEAVHYSTLVGIRVGIDEGRKTEVLYFRYEVLGLRQRRLYDSRHRWPGEEKGGGTFQEVRSPQPRRRN